MLKKIFYIFLSSFLSLSPIYPIKAAIISEKEKGDYTLNDMVQVAVNISNLILGIVGSLTLLMFIYGGVTMIISSGSSEKVTRGKEIIKNAIIGLIIVFASYTIIQFALSAMGLKNTGNYFTAPGGNN